MVENKYYRWYTNIIAHAKSAKREWKKGMYEKHHIIPKSIGGIDNKSNIVMLTFKEHYICHHLLTKFTEGEEKAKMYFAFWNMANKWGRKQTEYRITSGVYATLKEEVSRLISENNKGKSYPVSDATRALLSESKHGSKNPMYNKPAHNRGIKRPGVGGRKKGTTWSDEERAIHEAVRSKPGYYDYCKDPVRSKKISDALKGRSGPATGKKWYNNGNLEIYASSCPDGYMLGRLKRLQPNKQGMKWYNNGLVNKQFKDGFVEQGFTRGRISKK